MDCIDRNLHIAVWEWVAENPGNRNAFETILSEFAGGQGEDEDDVTIAVTKLVGDGNATITGERMIVAVLDKPPVPA